MTRLLALALAVTLGGCTSAPPSPAVATVDDLVLPFDAYKPTPGQRALLDTAHRALVTHCLTRRGAEVPALPPAPPDPGNSRRYGVTDPPQAAGFGYHLPRSGPTQGDGHGAGKPTEREHGSAAGRQSEDRASLPGTARMPARDRGLDVGRMFGKGRYLDALSGKAGRQVRECAARAAARLRPARKGPWRWLARRDARTLERSAARPAVRQAVTGWVACMQAAGHPYPSPEAAIGDPRWDLEQPEISADEKRTAVADTTCKWSSGLVARWFAADAALQRALVRKHAGRFALLRTDLNERVQRATTILERQRSG